MLDSPLAKGYTGSLNIILCKMALEPGMEYKDYYKTLGVDKNADDKEIKKAYRRLARQHHPDLNPGDKAAEARFKDLNEANEVLSDAEKLSLIHI